MPDFLLRRTYCHMWIPHHTNKCYTIPRWYCIPATSYHTQINSHKWQTHNRSHADVISNPQRNNPTDTAICRLSG